MRVTGMLIFLAAFTFVVLFCRESQAVIYKYENEKGEVILVDDLQRVPPERRASVVQVGEDAAPVVQADAERAQAVARALAAKKFEQQEQEAATERERASRRFRLILSGSIAVMVIIFFVVLGNIDALKDRRSVRVGIRAGLAAGLAVFLVIVNFPDISGLFRRSGAPVVESGPLAEFQRKQAERGKKAAESMKAFNDAMNRVDGPAKEETQRIEKQFEEAEKGR